MWGSGCLWRNWGRGWRGSYKTGDAQSWALHVCAVATQRKTQCRANLSQARGAELRYALAEAFLRHCHYVVQVDGAGRLHAILFVQQNLRRHIANLRRNRRNSNSGEVRKRTIASKHDHRPYFIWRREAKKPNFSMDYSSGHAASASHGSHSSLVWGRLA